MSKKDQKKATPTVASSSELSAYFNVGTVGAKENVHVLINIT